MNASLWDDLLGVGQESGCKKISLKIHCLTSEFGQLGLTLIMMADCHTRSSQDPKAKSPSRLGFGLETCLQKWILTKTSKLRSQKWMNGMLKNMVRGILGLIGEALLFGSSGEGQSEANSDDENWSFCSTFSPLCGKK